MFESQHIKIFFTVLQDIKNNQNCNTYKKLNFHKQSMKSQIQLIRGVDSAGAGGTTPLVLTIKGAK